jgi:hypothetical protein
MSKKITKSITLNYHNQRHRGKNPKSYRNIKREEDIKDKNKNPKSDTTMEKNTKP